MWNPSNKGNLLNPVQVSRTAVDMSEVQSDMVPMQVFNPTLETITVKEVDCTGKVIPVVSCKKVDVQDSCNDQNDGENVIDVINRIPAHLQDLYWECVTELPLEQHRRVAKLLIKYQDVFSADEYDLGRTGMTRHYIDTRFAAPNRERPRRMAPSQQAEVDRQIKDMLARGVVEPSSSPWSSPIVLVTKKDGEQKILRGLSEAESCNGEGFLSIYESLDSLFGAKWFSTLDLCSGYWQVELD